MSGHRHAKDACDRCEEAPAQLQGLLEFQAPHAGAPVHELPQLLVIPACQAHGPLIPAQHRQAVQMEQSCMRFIVLLSVPPASHLEVGHAGSLTANAPQRSSSVLNCKCIFCASPSAALLSASAHARAPHAADMKCEGSLPWSLDRLPGRSAQHSTAQGMQIAQPCSCRQNEHICQSERGAGVSQRVRTTIHRRTLTNDEGP